MTSPYSRTRNKQLVRVLRLLQILRQGRMRLDTLSSELSVSPRTIRRDIEAIESACLPVRKFTDGEGVARWTIRWEA